MNSTDTRTPTIFDDPSALNLTPRQATVLLPSLLEFLKKHSTRIGDILNGEAGKWSAKDLRELERIVVQESSSSERAADYLRVLRKACAFWAARERLNVAYPRIPTQLVHPPNPFRGNFAKLLRIYDSWKRVLDHWLDAMKDSDPEPNDSSAGLAIDALVLSSILYGGLHTRSSIAAMLRVLAAAQDRTICVDGRMHIELSLSWRGIPDVEFRRWQPDALTATLWAAMPDGAIGVLLDPGIELVRLSALTDVELAKKVKDRIDARLKQTAVLEESPRGGLDRLLQAASLAAYTEIPAILAAYAGRKMISHSLKRRAFERLSSGERRPFADTPATIEKDANVNVDDTSVLRTPGDLEPEWLQDVRSALSAETAREVTEAMKQLSEKTDGPSFVGRLADFLDWLLKVRTPSGRPRTLSSAKRTVVELARSMGLLLELPDPLDLDSDSREELYSRMIESKGSLPSEACATSPNVPDVSKRRRNLSRALYEFERYLNSKGKERIEDESLFCGRFGLSAVDANLVTFEEYDAALKEVDKVWSPHDDSERNRIAKVLLCLGFRCGLRRREALHCLTTDIGPAPDYEFLVRPSEYRKLKSRSARRRIPLRHFLPSKEGHDELGLVLDWLKQRRNDSEASAFLLGMKDHPQAVTEAIFEDLNRILRKVTRDEGMHFHQLRHSFAGWNWLRLMIADLPPAPDLFPDLKQTSEWLREGPEFRKQIYGHGGVTRKHAYFAAQQLGHLSPSTSMQTYIHFADYALAHFLKNSVRMRPSKDRIIKARKMSRRTAEGLDLNATSPLAFPVALWSRRFSQENPDQVSQGDIPPADVGWARCVYDFLHDIERGVPIEKAAELHRFDSVSAHKIYQGMDDLGYARSQTGRWLRKEGRIGGKSDRLSWPSDPCDMAIIRQFEGRLAELAETEADVTADALRCYRELVWDTKPMVVFHDPSDAEGKRAFAFVQFLNALEIGRKSIRWFSFIKGSRSSYLAKWKRHVKYNRHDNDIENIPRPGGEKWFGIMPQLDKWAGEQHAENPGAYGFRFLMRMAYLRWR